MFDSTGQPPQVIVTRWGSWLSAALFYSENLPAVKLAMEEISEDGKIKTAAKML